jgi:hypothetical protein
VRAIYGCSFGEFCAELFGYGFTRGREEGEREGRTTGRRAAKGLKTPAKKRGRPAEFDEQERPLLIFVVENRKPGQTIRAAVTRFLQIMEAGERSWADALSPHDHPPREAGKRLWADAFSPHDHPPREAKIRKAQWAYYRHRPRKRPS